MSEFTDLSRAAYQAISGNDLDGFLKLADKDVEFNSLIEGRTYHGHKGVREWWKKVIGSLGGIGLELKEVSDFDDRGYVKMVAEDVGDVGLPQEIWQAMRIENGKAVWWGIFGSEDEAREALGVGKKD